ncbi:MAG: acetylxylan esterase, partial [Planctomycetales bacterium]|nr:acetylxylan esterase [Planctomycetales bacterium]
MLTNRRAASVCAATLLVSAVAAIINTDVANSSAAEVGRCYVEGHTANDARLEALTDLNGYFPFHVPATREQWEARRRELQERLLVASGLWPQLERTPLKPVIHSKLEREGFTVEHVYFQSMPGFYVTGLLFRPTGDSKEKRPAVLSPHGHGSRSMDYGAQGIRELIAEGAERFEGSGRYPRMARCAQLARMGCVTFIYDMVGYEDSQQIPITVAHQLRDARAEMEDPNSWGLFSTPAELRLQSIYGLQTWNSMRSLDFLCSLPDVDPVRIGVTGNSGGGTQTMMVCALDPRPIVDFPQGMVSTAMQGGCTCENACYLRIGTGNVEIAALFAPKPMGMTAADDWTIEMMTKGYPELQQLYAMLGAKDQVFCKSLTQFPHNFNYVSREVMYQWFNKHMKLGLAEPVLEEDHVPLAPTDWTVWNDQHPQPKGGPEYEKAFCQIWDRMSRDALDEYAPKDATSAHQHREMMSVALRVMTDRGVPTTGTIARDEVSKLDRGDHLLFTDIIQRKEVREEVPMLSLFPSGGDWNGQVVVWLSGRGKSALLDDAGAPQMAVNQLLASGAAVVGIDVLGQGEHRTPDFPQDNRLVDNPRQVAAYTYAYNQPLLAQRVSDVLTLLDYLATHERTPKRIDLVCVDGAAPWGALAAAQAGDRLSSVAVDTQGFRFSSLRSWKDQHMLPGAVKYGDLPGMLALVSPRPLCLLGESGETP